MMLAACHHIPGRKRELLEAKLVDYVFLISKMGCVKLTKQVFMKLFFSYKNGHYQLITSRLDMVQICL
jgi:hypothetical protein